MASTLPSTLLKVPGTNWTFSMNPGPFNIKEHVLLCVLATSGLSVPSSATILTVRKVFYHKYLNFWVGLLLTLTSQMLGYGFAGIFMKFLVNNPYMWYPFTLVDVFLYRSIHEVMKSRPQRGITKFQFFILAAVTSFAYAIVPGYFFPSLGALSVVCWLWKDSVTAQLIGSGRNGFGIGSFALDWNAIAAYSGNPLVYPLSTIINMTTGFIFFLYIITPIAYFTNSNNARHFPFSSTRLFDKYGHLYNVSKVVKDTDLTFNSKAYQGYSNLYLSVVYLFALGFEFAAVTASLSHFIAFYGRDAWQQFKQAYVSSNNSTEDVHNRLMKKYKPVPQWWYLAILITAVGLAILSCEAFGDQLQLPYWGILFSCLLILIFVLPLGVLQATTGQYISLNLISEMLVGYIYPGKPIANMVFKAYSVTAEDFALAFISELKLAHYMKIAPKSMFVAQIIGTFVSSVVGFATSWWLLSAVEHICDPKNLPKGSPWTCPSKNNAYSTSVVWGVIGPQRMFYPHGLYSKLFYFFLIGLICPLLVWVLSKFFPEKKWIKDINVSNLLGGKVAVAVGGATSFLSFVTVGFVYNLVVYRKYKDWWAKYNYVLSNGLDVGVAFLSLLTSLCLGMSDIYGVNWWGLDAGDHCPLAQCPTAPGVSVDGCPAP
ncbi:Oligopeptide transporter 1 [Citrus sinensis]|nr:Oligopeptide transporter 1 [Citrus sinensis]